MPRSLRSRVVLGALLWTLGLIAVSHIVRACSTARDPDAAASAHSTLLLIFAHRCLIGGLSQVRGGLAPFDRLALAAGRRARRPRAADRMAAIPTEVQPLVEDLNALLDHREQALRARAVEGRRPRARAEDAARRAGAGSGRAPRRPVITISPPTIEQQVERMRRQMDYHLAHARAAASGATPAPGAPSPNRPRASRARCAAARGPGVTIEIQVSPGHARVRA